MIKKRVRLTDENDPLTPTDKVLAGLERVSKSGVQEVDSMESQEVSNTTSQEVVNLESQEFNNKNIQEDSKSTIQQADKLKLRKSTFQLSQSVLERLDIFHLQLQLELGKSSAPYKEVIVEEAIAQLLDQASESRTELLAALQERQETRS